MITAEELEMRVIRAEKLMLELLGRVGKRLECRGPHCHAPVFMVRHQNGVLGIYNLDGESHFVTCVDRALFKPPKKEHS